MKDSEFIELLNLYLDHEISARDAARLEAEVQASPERRRIYQGYCRMQKACKALAHDFVSESAPATARNVVAFDAAAANRRSSKPYLYVGGLAAAAACVALVLSGRIQPKSADITSTPNTVVQATPAVQSPAALPAVPAHTTSELVAASDAPAGRGIGRGAVGSLTLRATSGTNPLSLTNVQTDPRFAWIQDVRLAPLQMPVQPDPLQFNANSANQSENRTYSSDNKPLPADVKWIAFRYQK